MRARRFGFALAQRSRLVSANGAVVAVAVAASLFFLVAPSPALLGGPSVEEVSDAITELEVDKARALIGKLDADSTGAAIERARLSLYVGDCDTAQATLASLTGVKEAAPLADLAKNCARATAGSVVIEDKEHDLWIRLQDEGDRVLLPVLADVAVKARAAIVRDLGIELPKPLRIDLVRDLFSLSAVSGLPLQAAETTGTVAVARWGRVNMISPRAATLAGGYPWEDTLQHEMTHLALSHATRDQAPLWLQEGLAKRQETRWRPPRPFDGDPAPDEVAQNALLTGESVGIDQLGPSIAMLPSADAASIAFAEVSSFIEYWIKVNGQPALRLLFQDLKGLGTNEASRALESASGYDLSGWIVRWQDYLRHLPPPKGAPLDQVVHREPISLRERARQIRTGELLEARGLAGQAVERFRVALSAEPHDASVRFLLGKSLIEAGDAASGAPLFESVKDVDAGHPGWFALAGRYRRDKGDPEANSFFDWAVAIDPYLEEAACEGRFASPSISQNGASSAAPPAVPEAPERRALCESARKIPRD
jgi:hypothetical protein